MHFVCHPIVTWTLLVDVKDWLDQNIVKAEVLCGDPGLWPYWCHEYKQKSSVELLAYFLTDFIFFLKGI